METGARFSRPDHRDRHFGSLAASFDDYQHPGTELSTERPQEGRIWYDLENRSEPRLLTPWPRPPLRPKRAKRRRWARLRPRPRRLIHDIQGWRIFDRRNGEFSSAVDTAPPEVVWNLSLQTGSEGPALISRVVAHSNSLFSRHSCSWRTLVQESVKWRLVPSLRRFQSNQAQF